MSRRLHLDFETFSTKDLTRCGLHIYADPQYTEVLCAAWAFDDEPVQSWTEMDVSDLARARIRELFDHVASGGEVVAHNAAFEFWLWNKVFAPGHPLKIEQMTCTMAMAYAMGLPGTLEKAAAALGVSQQKDMEGSRIMKQLCQPKEILPDGTIIRWTEPEKYDKLLAYCKQDVVVEREIEKRMFQLSAYEKKVWILDQKINNTGITVDKPAVTKAVKLVEVAKDQLDEKMRAVTNNEVATCTAVQQIKDHLEFYGFFMDSLNKSDVTEHLENPNLHPHVHDVLKLRSLGGKAATAKLTPMLNGIAQDNKLRGMFQYSAAGTRRWGGRRVQLQNLKRHSLPAATIDTIITDITNGATADQIDLIWGSPLEILSECTRGFLTASPGNELLVCDFAAIEARVLAWLACQNDVLDIFINREDIYLTQASSIFSQKITDKHDPRRQIGKVAILALGYQGGVGALQTMAKGYNVKMAPAFKELWNTADPEVREMAIRRFNDAGTKYEISKEEFLASEIVKIKWRFSNPQIVEYWAKIENAMIEAIKNPDQVQTIGRLYGRPVSFKKSGSFLWCRLPSGGVICYPYPELREIKTPWGTKRWLPTYMAEESQSKKWMRFSAYGGLIVENITQSVARDLLADSMLRLDAEGFNIVAHVHDEIICDMPKGCGRLDRMSQIMSQNPTWAHDLPTDATGWVGHRYRK